MKLAFALLLAIVVTPSQAAECTPAQLSSFGSATETSEFEKACNKALGGTAPTSLDAATLAALNPCGDVTCTAFFKELASQAPDCEIMGMSLRASFDLVVSLCGGATDGDATDGGGTPSLPLPTWPSEPPASGPEAAGDTLAPEASMSTLVPEATTSITTTTKPPSNMFPGIIPSANPQAGAKSAAASAVVAKTTGLTLATATVAWIAAMY